MIDGPRSLRTGEMASLRELEAKVFRPSMPEEYPQVFNEDTYEGLTVCFDGSRCVSHVGMVARSASLFGCRIDIGLIGGVATDPEYRGQGLAGACVDHAFARARREGIDFLMISGDRSLYQRRDCVAVGRDSLFTLSSANADDLSKSLPSLYVEPITEAELPLIGNIYRQEPVRFLRHLEDYQDLFQCGIVLNQLSDFLGVRVAGSELLQAYLIVPRRTDKNGNIKIAEIAGDRRAVLAATCQLFSRYQDLSHLRIHVSCQDNVLHSLLTQSGLQPETVTTSGTVRIVNFSQFMDRLRPLVNETLGRHTASALSFQEEGDTCIFRFRNEALRVGRADAARLLFGTPTQSEESLYASLGSEFATILRTLLPFPALWYGLSFV